MKNRLIVITLVIALMFLLTGCFGGEQTDTLVTDEQIQKPTQEPAQEPIIITLNNTFTTRFREVNAVTWPSFAFDFPDNWTITDEDVSQQSEFITLTNDRGVTISYSHFSGSVAGGGSAVTALRVEVSKVANSSFVPAPVNIPDEEEPDLREFMVARLKVTGTLEDYTFVDVDGSTAFAVIPVSHIGTDYFVRRPFVAEYAFAYAAYISFVAQAPDGEFTEAEEREVIAILQSFRLVP